MSFNNVNAPFANVLAVQAVIDPASVAAASVAEQTFAVPGVPAPATPSIVDVNVQTPTANVGIGNCRASAVNQVGIQFINPTAGALDPASQTYNILVQW